MNHNKTQQSGNKYMMFIINFYRAIIWTNAGLLSTVSPGLVKLQLNLNQTTTIFILESEWENFVCKILAI